MSGQSEEQKYALDRQLEASRIQAQEAARRAQEAQEAASKKGK